MQDTCLFCKIANGSEPSLSVFEDEHTFAFLDKRPLFLGHTLLVPKQHYATLHDLPLESTEPFFTNTKKISAAIEKAMQADGTFIALNNRVSQSVPHLHVHIVPRKFKDGLKGFFWPRQQYENAEAAHAVQAKIRASMQKN